MIETISAGLKSPFQKLGLTIQLTIFLLIASVIGFIAAGAGLFSSFVPASGIVQVILYIVAALLLLLVFGTLGQHFRQLTVGVGGNKLGLGIMLFVVAFIYSLPYTLTLFVYGAFGIILSLLYWLFLLVCLPAILSMTAKEHSFGAGFNWRAIGELLQRKSYWIALGVGVVTFIVYSLISYIINAVLLLIAVSEAVFMIVSIVSLLVYLFLFSAALVSVTALFAKAQAGVAAMPQKQARNSARTARRL